MMIVVRIHTRVTLIAVNLQRSLLWIYENVYDTNNTSPTVVVSIVVLFQRHRFQQRRGR